MIDTTALPVTLTFGAGTTVPAVRAGIAGFTLTGFASGDAMTFHLAREATALDGLVRLIPDVPVTVVEVGPDAVRVHADDQVLDLDAVAFEAACDALRFDDFDGEPAFAPARGGIAAVKDAAFGVRRSATGPVIVTLHARAGAAVFVDELETRGDATHVVVTTNDARVEGWLASSELDHGDPAGAPPTGHLSCGAPRPDAAPAWPPIIVATDADVLVAAEPGGRGPAGLRVAKGTRVHARDAGGGWAELASPSRAIAPPDGMRFFVPWSLLSRSARS